MNRHVKGCIDDETTILVCLGIAIVTGFVLMTWLAIATSQMPDTGNLAPPITVPIVPPAD